MYCGVRVVVLNFIGKGGGIGVVDLGNINIWYFDEGYIGVFDYRRRFCYNYINNGCDIGIGWVVDFGCLN